MTKELSRGSEVYTDEVFQILAEYEISRSIRYPTPVGMLTIEMIPTGHDEKSLRAAPKIFTATLNAHLRSVDIPSVIGREYRVLLPTTSEHGTRSLCERLISVFRNKLSAEDGSSIAFSLNIGGVSHGGGDSLSYQSLLEKSANALKQSKLKGPNTFVVLS